MADGVKKRVRTCIGCGLQFDKAELHRIVRTPEGEVRFDAGGRAAGRGAYVCSRSCLESAIVKGKLQRSLKCSVGKEGAALIASELERALSSALAR